jgi:TRAP-type C4-dicarboxylate transport system substrate-binding protein
MSGGRITVEYISAGALAGELGAFDAVRAGVVELAAPWVGGYDSILVEAKCLYGLPFGLRHIQEVLTLYYERGWEDLLREAYMELDPPLYYLAPELWQPVFPMTNVPVTSLDQLKKLKIRAYGSAAKYLEKLGVKTVPITYEELYTAIATGTIDGALGLGSDEFFDIKFYEFAKYMLQPPFISACEGADYVVNMDAWNSLPEDLQAIVYRAAQNISATGGVGCTDYALIYDQKMLDAGCSWSEIRDADLLIMAEKAKEMWDEVAAVSPRNAKMMEIYEQYMKELGY